MIPSNDRESPYNTSPMHNNFNKFENKKISSNENIQSSPSKRRSTSQIDVSSFYFLKHLFELSRKVKHDLFATKV